MQGMAGQGAEGPEVWIRGPVAGAGPQQSPPAQGAVTPRRFAWVATHGGAGATTLAAVFGGHDAGRNWPRPDAGEPGSVLLVARTHAAGLDSVAHTLETFRRGEAPPQLDLDAVVLVADAPGRLPRPLAQGVKAIEALVDVYHVPWVPAWRLGDLAGEPPRECAPLARLTGAGADPATGRKVSR
ncbi:DUF6668 family protein [Streptomyces sp. NPDC059785]|uniref:DUF6668 family protein n=1 Tax=unclassified Streptomyces TaxID=2593676 RepID=UPI0036639440